MRTAGIAGLAAGALSMALGEYVSVASQRDIEQADLRIERQALEEHPVAELRELAQIWEARGVEPELAMEVARQLTEQGRPRGPRPRRARPHRGHRRPPGAGGRSRRWWRSPSARSCRWWRSSWRRTTAARPSSWPRPWWRCVGLGWLGAALGAASRLRAMARVGLGGAAAMGITLLIGELTGAALG